MTIKELYEWAIKNEVENYSVEILYRDDGGYYHGTSALREDEIKINKLYSEVIL